jgi:hypothetical protein
MRFRYLPAALIVLGTVAAPAETQIRETELQVGTAAYDGLLTPARGPLAQTRPPLSTEFVLMQAAAGLAGGIAGSLVMILPFAITEMGGKRDVPNSVPVVTGVLGYLAGSAAGVQVFSRRAGMRGSWWWTLGGATAGAIGGPAFLITVPAGATVGFNSTRRYPSNSQETRE